MVQEIHGTSVKKIVVDQSGSGDYVKIQDAIDAVQPRNSRRVYITVRPGIYKEKVVVPKDKPYITLSGSKAKKTIVLWSDGGDIMKSGTFIVLASDFVARELTFKNTRGKDEKGVALRVSADKVAFYGCRFLGYQNTLFDERGRHYYKKCYIEGSTDFIFGNGDSTFENCHLNSISPGKGSITAQGRQSPLENTGFTFINCNIMGREKALLGRPWSPYARVVFAKSYISGGISPEGWGDWGGDSSRQRTAYFGEYDNHGPGAKTNGRVSWTKTLSSQEVQPYLSKITNWLKKSNGPILKTKRPRKVKLSASSV